LTGWQRFASAPLLLLLLRTVYFSVFSQVSPLVHPVRGVQGGRAGPYFYGTCALLLAAGLAAKCFFSPFFKWQKRTKKWLINRRRSLFFFVIGFKLLDQLAISR
jgi:hypothetical protein